MSGVIIQVIVTFSAMWVYLDATDKEIGRILGKNGFFNIPAGAWAVATMLLWIVGFPAYLIKRRSLLDSANQHPVKVKNRALKAFCIGFAGAVLVAMSLLGTVVPSP